MKAMILVLFAFLSALVYSQNVDPNNWSPYTAWTADFICTAPQFGTGFFRGKCTYDWSVGAMSIVFEGTEAYSEFYQFNTDRGYKQDSPSGQFAFQYLYKSSKSCPCETTGLNFAMPAFFSGAEKMQSISGIDYWTGQTPNDGTLSTGLADKWIASPGFVITVNGQPKSYTIASFFWLKGGVPAGFNINDFQRRTFALENIVAGPPGQLGLIAPKSGCKCGKQMDVVLSLDRSGSISRDQWGLEYQFTQNLVNAFTYGPLATNLGIVNWNAATWPTLALTSGISDTVVKSAVGSMTCCPGASATSCCCCGTPIGGGIRVGANMLAESTRGKAQKVLILLTDGCQNHLWDPKANKGVSCGCANEKACATNATCVNDIVVNYDYVEENIPGTRVIAVGVGGADTICKEQLQLAAGGDPLNVYTPTSWSQLLTLVETITATACTADNALCPGCCGICTCGQCIPPPNCLDPNKCNKGVLDSTGCCGSQPITCDRQPCKFEYCDDKQGCLYDAIECPPDETCVTYVCNNSFTCAATKKTNPDGSDIAACVSVPVYECVDNVICDDKNNCTTDICVNPATGNSDCVNTPIDCKESQTDQCVRYSCSRFEGCVEEKKTCDDRNLCTIDSCDPKKGCVFQNITCPAPNNTCEYVICDQYNGCTYLPIDCTKAENGGLKAENCTVPACDKDPKVGCYDQFICAAPPPTSTETGPDTVVLVSTLTTAAVAGIVCAAVLLAAGLGGGAAVAVAQIAGGGGAVVTASNPLYAGTGVGGDNPLNQG